MLGRNKDKSEQAPLKLLLWTAIAGLIFGLVGFGQLAEDTLRTGRNSLHKHAASGDIVLVAIDDKSLREAGRWPWPRRHHAELTDRLTAAGANRIYIDVILEGRSNGVDDTAFARAIERSGNVVLAVRGDAGPAGNKQSSSVPLEALSRHAALASIGVAYNYQNAAWQLPYSARVDEQVIPSFAASLANKASPANYWFTPDYSIEPSSIPAISASDVLFGRFDPASVKGKDVVIGANSEVLGDQYFIPGFGKLGGAYVQIIGAETLKSGTPIQLGWGIAYLLALAIAAFALFRRSRRQQALVLGGAIPLTLFGPAPLEANLIFMDVMPGLFVIATVGTVLAWRGFRQRGLVNPVSGLPNLDAMRANRAARDQAILVARIMNYAEIVASLPSEQERQLIDQVIARLRVGSDDRVLYQGDGGIFAWFDEPRLPFGNHIDALYSLFRSPARVGGQPIDLSVSFGVEIGSSRSIANRLASALVAAEDAAHHGLKWKYHDPESLENAAWKLSMLSQLDSAVDKGEVWVAYQPQLDLATRQIIGAEALARWTHPEKGPIAASEFVAAAEQHDRIGKLTDFVLEQAIRAAAMLNRKRPGFSMAVNLSARLLDDRGFLLRLSAMLARHGLSAKHLTLELTETATLTGNGSAVDLLGALRDLGVTISIDDYGTGFSTLDYLKRIPASEIKIDQSFVKGMLDSRSDRVMVQSTIALAHSLDRKVVAEGVERREVLDALIEMKCDVAQGFIIGRPMSLDSIAKRISAPGRLRVA